MNQTFLTSKIQTGLRKRGKKTDKNPIFSIYITSLFAFFTLYSSLSSFLLCDYSKTIRVLANQRFQITGEYKDI